MVAPGQALRTPALAHDGTIYIESAGRRRGFMPCPEVREMVASTRWMICSSNRTMMGPTTRPASRLGWTSWRGPDGPSGINGGKRERCGMALGARRSLYRERGEALGHCGWPCALVESSSPVPVEFQSLVRRFHLLGGQWLVVLSG
jgi:hypothetical protein